jgi:DNA-directed RNA polymerase delta subunit
MNLKDMTKEEIEALSYTDLTCILLTENKKPMSTAEIFKKICEILGYSDAEYSEKIGDYYTSLTIDKRFVLLDDAKWDLRKNHAVELKVEDDEEEETEEEEIENNEEEEETDEDIETSIDDEDIDTDDDLDDLSVLSDDDIEEEN